MLQLGSDGLLEFKWSDFLFFFAVNLRGLMQGFITVETGLTTQPLFSFLLSFRGSTFSHL